MPERPVPERGHVPDVDRAPSRFGRIGWRSTLVGVLIWCILWGKIDLLTIFGGLAITWGVALMFPLPAIRYRGRIRPWGVLKLLVVTLVNLVVSSTQVAALAVSWRRPVKSAIVGVKLRTTSDLLVAMIVELIGLVPGSVVVEQMRASSRVYVHVLDVQDGTELEAAYAMVRGVEERVIRAFGTDEEVALVDHGPPPDDRPTLVEPHSGSPAGSQGVRTTDNSHGPEEHR